MNIFRSRNAPPLSSQSIIMVKLMQMLKIKYIQFKVSTGVLVLIGPTEAWEDNTSPVVQQFRVHNG
jgi:hypothetical protein